MVNTQFDRITVDPDRLGGKPCIRELRISVGMVVQMVAAGKTIEEILAEYPYLEAEDVKQALGYSAALAESEYHTAEGDTAEHVHQVIGAGASDHEVMQHAIDHGAVIITADTNFGGLLVHGGRTEPSVILVRELLSLPVASQGRLLAADLDQIRRS